MDINEYIKTKINEHSSIRIVAEKIDMNEKTLANKLRIYKLTAEDLLKVACAINLDLNKLKEEYENEKGNSRA